MRTSALEEFSWHSSVDFRWIEIQLLIHGCDSTLFPQRFNVPQSSRWVFFSSLRQHSWKVPIKGKSTCSRASAHTNSSASYFSVVPGSGVFIFQSWNWLPRHHHWKLFFPSCDSTAVNILYLLTHRADGSAYNTQKCKINSRYTPK